MRNIFLIIIILLLLFFQSSIIYSQPTLKRIDLEKGIRLTENLPVSEIATNIQYIPLETNMKCLLGQSPRIQLTDHFIFIATDMEHLYRFSKNGKFLNEIGRVGKGPGEYIQMINYLIDEKAQHIYANDTPFGGKVICYNFEGKFLREFKVKTNSMMFEFIDDYIMFQNQFYTHANGNKQADEIVIIDKKGKLIQSFPSTTDPSRKYGISLIPALGYISHNEFHYKAPYCDTVFTVSNLKIKTPKYYFDMGHMGRPLEADEFRNTKIKNKVAVMDMIETPGSLFLTCTGEKHRQGIIYNKIDQSITNVVNIDKTGFEEDISCGLPFWPSLYCDSRNEKLLVDFVFPQDLIAHVQTDYYKQKLNSSTQARTLKEICAKMKESDNLVIRIVTLK